MTYPSILNKNVATFQSWLREIADYVGDDDDLSRSLASLKGTLHEIRDHLPIELAANLSEQLPLILRGIFFEGWNPHHTAFNERKLEDFLEAIYGRFSNEYPGMDPSKYALAVFDTLSRHVSKGIIDKITKVLPKQIRDFLNQAIDGRFRTSVD